uniref:Uncharacterized protein n=1 Tax=Trichogramma kaykai TaxID=54128 RepID=A0ABD2VTQ0_9HYME
MATTAARGTAPAAATAAPSIIIRPTIIITRTRARLALLLRRPMIKHATSSSSSNSSRKLVIRYCYVNATRLSYHYMRFENLYIFTIITVCDMPIDYMCKKKEEENQSVIVLRCVDFKCCCIKLYKALNYKEGDKINNRQESFVTK